jgi:hypothetical protein
MLRKLLAHLLFLPNVMIPLGMPGIETFPHATLFSLNRRTTVTVGYALILIILGGSAVYGLFTIGQPFSIIRDYVSIINASLIFYRIIHTDREDYDLIVKALITIFLLNIGISILQRTSLLPNFMYEAIRFFIPRVSRETLDFMGGRGVSGLFPEPAYAAYAMHYWFAFLFIYTKTHPFSRKGLPFLILILIWDLVVARSATDIAYLGAYLIGYITLKNIPYLALGLFGLLGLAYLNVNFSDDPPRSLWLIYQFIFGLDSETMRYAFLNESGYRFVTTYGGYLYGLANPFGGGIGSFLIHSVEAQEMTGVMAYELHFFLNANDGHYYAMRPSALGSALFLAIGWVGALSFVSVLFSSISDWRFLRVPQGRAVFSLFLFSFFALGTIGDPIPTAVLALSILTITRMDDRYNPELEGQAKIDPKSLGKLPD